MQLPRGDASSERVVYGLIALLALVVIYVVAFVLSNTTSVRVSFVLFETDASLIWVMLICTLLGLLAGVLVSRVVARRREVRAAHEVGATGSAGARPAATT